MLKRSTKSFSFRYQRSSMKPFKQGISTKFRSVKLGFRLKKLKPDELIDLFIGEFNGIFLNEVS